MSLWMKAFGLESASATTLLAATAAAAALPESKKGRLAGALGVPGDDVFPGSVFLCRWLGLTPFTFIFRLTFQSSGDAATSLEMQLVLGRDALLTLA